MPHPLDPDTAAVFAAGVSRFLLERTLSVSAAERWLDRLTRDGHLEAAELVRGAIGARRLYDLSRALPGGAT